MEILTDENQEAEIKKISIRCLAFACRDEGTVNFLRSEPSYFIYLGETLKIETDEEILANTSKIIRVCLRNQKITTQFYKVFPDLIDTLIYNVEKFFYSNAITEETLASIRNYTKKIEYLVHIKNSA